MIYESQRQPDSDQDYPQDGTTPEVDGDISSPIDQDTSPQPGSGKDEPSDTVDAPDVGEVTAAPQIWTAEQTARFQQRWHALQLRFVDDPRSAVEQAAALVGEATDEFSSAVSANLKQLDAWRDNGGKDGEATEHMRIAVLNYHHLLDRLLAR
jgi:hypothetical protein